MFWCNVGVVVGMCGLALLLSWFAVHLKRGR